MRDGNQMNPICNVPNWPGCTAGEGSRSVIVNACRDGTCEDYTLMNPMVASYKSGKVDSEKLGLYAKTKNIHIVSSDDERTANITVAARNIPFPRPMPRPQRNIEGIVTNDVNTHYMDSYNMRMFKVVDPEAHLYMKKIALSGGGVSEKFGFNPEYTERTQSGTQDQAVFEVFDMIKRKRRKTAT